MKPNSSNNSSRRRFVRASLGAGAFIQARQGLFAGETGIVPTMVSAASHAKIEVYPVRRNIP
jgi:hypothetical protein